VLPTGWGDSARSAWMDALCAAAPIWEVTQTDAKKSKLAWRLVATLALVLSVLFLLILPSVGAGATGLIREQQEVQAVILRRYFSFARRCSFRLQWT